MIHISSGAVVLDTREGRNNVILLYRYATKSWHLPKGTMKDGETIEATALREVQEETGFTIRLDRYLGKLDSEFLREGLVIAKQTHYFLAFVVGSSTIAHDAEHDEVHFLDYSTALRHLEDFSLYEKEGEILKMAEPCFA